MTPQQAMALQLLINELQLQTPNWNTVHSALQNTPPELPTLTFDDDGSLVHMSCSKKAPLCVVQLLVQQHPAALQKKNTFCCLPLHMACANEQSFNVIQWLVRQHPYAVKEKNKDGYLPLHLACGNGQSFEVIQLLVEQHPDAVKEKTMGGYLPVHWACINGQSLEVIQLLVQQYPNAVKDEPVDGDLLLHLACAFEQSFEMIQWLIEQHTDAVKEKSTNGYLPLHYACAENQSLEVIQLLIQKYTNSVKERNKKGSLPLHMACTANNQSLEVIQLLVWQHPVAVKEMNVDGYLPLHFVCSAKQSFEVIQWLSQKHPNAVKEKNKMGSLPLHIACTANNQPLEVIQLLVEQHPDAVKEMNVDGYLPLHFACSAKQSFEVIQWLSQKHPNAVKEKNKMGSLPLHIACTANIQPLEVIQLLVEQHPDAVKEMNVDGYLPLHFACSAKQSLELIQWLIQKHPNAVKEKNSDGCLPLHVACAAKDRSFEVIQLLVGQHPDAVKDKDVDGYLPLHFASAHNQSLELIQWLIQKHPNAVKEKNNDGCLPLHIACAAKDQSFEVIQLLVEQHPDAVKDKDKHGHTPLDYANHFAKHPRQNQITDPRIVELLEKVVSSQTILPKLTRATPKLASRPSEDSVNGPCSPSGPVVVTDLAKLPVATSNDCLIDRSSVLAVLVGKNAMATVSPSYIESILTEERIGNGFFGPVYKGTDKVLKRSFAIKAIGTDILWDGRSADVQRAKEAFLKEMKALSLFRHPNIESLYAYAFPDDIKNCCYLVCELAEKGSLAKFWKSDLGPERLSLFHRRIQIALDVMTAIQFLHIGTDQISSCGHGNIQSASIVLKRDFTAQLIDCGLAKFEIDHKELQSKTTVFEGEAGHLCPEYGSGGVTFERSWDIFSFGVVLAELLTGTLQRRKDEWCASFIVETQYVKHEKVTAQDMKKDLDPALGFDTWELPKYVNDFADLTICCMQPKPEDRPTGDAVMEKLWTILSQCCVRNCDSSCGNHVGDSRPYSLELKSQDKCKFCRTFSPQSPQSVCAVCQSAQERRSLLSFCGESRRQFAATNAELNASLPLLSHFDIRLNNPVPRLFIIAPSCLKSAMTDPKAWLRSHHRTRYCLYFVCIHSLKAIAPPVPIMVTKCWLEKVSPVLAMSLYLLQLGLEPGDCIGLDYEETRMTLKLSSTIIAELLEAVSETLTETGRSDVLVHLRRSAKLDAEDIRVLNGDAFELISEAAGEERGWRDRMEPVRKDGSRQIFWVSKEVANDTSNGYDIVQR